MGLNVGFDALHTMDSISKHITPDSGVPVESMEVLQANVFRYGIVI
jgi:hypothetical protein